MKFSLKIISEYRNNKIFSDSHNSPSHVDRKIVYNLIKNNNLFGLQSSRLNFIEITKIYNHYNFAISPRGNGWDCHRTWELFLAGVIVIMKSSPLDEMFIKNDLPVIILNDWSDLNLLTENKLLKYIEENKEKRSLNNILAKLTFKYWINLEY